MDYLREAKEFLADAKSASAHAAALIAICERLDKLVAQFTPIQAELTEIREAGPLWTEANEAAADELGRPIREDELPF